MKIIIASILTAFTLAVATASIVQAAEEKKVLKPCKKGQTEADGCREVKKIDKDAAKKKANEKKPAKKEPAKKEPPKK